MREISPLWVGFRLDYEPLGELRQNIRFYTPACKEAYV